MTVVKWALNYSPAGDPDEAYYKLYQIKKSEPKTAPYILPANIDAITIVRKYFNSIYNGDGISLPAIEIALRYEGIPREDRPLTAQKIQLYFVLVNNKQHEGK